MKCLNPLPITRLLKGKKFVGTDGLTYIEVPCGRCAACKVENKKAWAVRMMLECESYRERGIDSGFYTLTYDDDHVPLVAGKKGVHYDLKPKDVQDFWKRLRNRLNDLGIKDFKYYVVGEYGETTFRPHYHFIGMGLPMSLKSVVEDAWQNGIVDVEPVELASCNYVAGYIQKKLYGEVAEEEYDCREFPYSRMSKGISEGYFAKYGKKIYEDGYLSFKGNRVRIPRYFWKLVENGKIPDVPKIGADRAALDRQKYVRSYLDRTYAKLGLNTPELVRNYKDAQIEGLRYRLKKEGERNKRNKI